MVLLLMMPFCYLLLCVLATFSICCAQAAFSSFSFTWNSDAPCAIQQTENILKRFFHSTISHLHIHIITWAIPVLITINHLCTYLFLLLLLLLFFINTLRAQIYLYASFCSCSLSLSLFLCLLRICYSIWFYFCFNTCYNRIQACARE